MSDIVKLGIMIIKTIVVTSEFIPLPACVTSGLGLGAVAVSGGGSCYPGSCPARCGERKVRTAIPSLSLSEAEPSE